MAAAVPIEELAPGAQRQIEGRGLGHVLLSNRKFLVGVGIFVLLLLIAILGSQVAGPQALRSGAFKPRLGVGGPGVLLLGSTSVGQAVLAQLFQSIPNSMLVGLLAATLGAVIGLVSGYFGGKTDAALRVLIDVFLSVPSLLFLILIASLLRGVGVPLMAVIIGMFSWAWPARAVRAQVLSLKERPFIQV